MHHGEALSRGDGWWATPARALGLLDGTILIAAVMPNVASAASGTPASCRTPVLANPWQKQLPSPPVTPDGEAGLPVCNFDRAL
jgi:hypothetical protein